MGTSSWSFPGWAGLVWAGRHAAESSPATGSRLRAEPAPPRRRDRPNFYAPLSAEGFARHAAQVPDGFRFLVKASQLCTFPTLRDGPGRGAPRENPRFLDAAFARDVVVAPAVEGLGDRIGALLFQFLPAPCRDPGPASIRRAPVRLPREAAARPLYAVEIRDAGLLHPDHAAALAGAGASHGFTVHPSMPSLETQAAIAPVERQPALVVRWMLGHGRGYEEARDLYAPFDRLAAPIRRAGPPSPS